MWSRAGTTTSWKRPRSELTSSTTSSLRSRGSAGGSGRPGGRSGRAAAGTRGGRSCELPGSRSSSSSIRLAPRSWKNVRRPVDRTVITSVDEVGCSRVVRIPEMSIPSWNASAIRPLPSSSLPTTPAARRERGPSSGRDRPGRCGRPRRRRATRRGSWPAVLPAAGVDRLDAVDDPVSGGSDAVALGGHRPQTLAQPK